MASNLTAQVRSISQVTKAVAQGDLARTVDVDLRGEMLELKNTVRFILFRFLECGTEGCWSLGKLYGSTTEYTSKRSHLCVPGSGDGGNTRQSGIGTEASKECGRYILHLHVLVLYAPLTCHLRRTSWL